jgi:urease accessory protein
MRAVLFGLTWIATFVSPALAHPGPLSHVHSFADGIFHPLTGADHVLVMASVGLWGAMVGGRAIWVWPATFVAVMLVGFAAALLGLQISFVELAISASIAVLGLLAAVGAKAPVALGAAIVGLFAFFHGYAHGTEATATNFLPYAAGFTFSTAMLLTAGVGLGLFARGQSGWIGLAPMRRVRSVVRDVIPGDGGPR